jgi:nitroreductase
MELTEVINSRKSIRKYINRKVEKEKIEKILESGIKAPSGKNGQPWKFIVIKENKELLKQISKLTIYDSFVKTADCLILVFLNKSESYNYIKDVQGIGACIQNMLLTIIDLGLGACWIGEILNRDLYVREILKLEKNFDLMAVISIGYCDGETKQRKKKELKDCIINWQ